jgi:riboflavin synthase
MAAGLGFKDFTTGEVLTAADVDGYLMQGIWVFATTTARDAAVTAPSEGNFAFTKDTNSLWYYDGAAWVASGATGDIEGVTAGTGISGGGTSGTVTITNSMATAIDAKGDLVVGTAADTFSRLAVGATAGQVLTVDSAEATGMKWATPGGAGSSWSLLNTGGTALTGAATITVSGISGVDKVQVIVDGASAVNASVEMKIRFNANTSSVYRSGVGLVKATSTAADIVQHSGGLDNAFLLGTTGTTRADNSVYGGVSITGCNSSGFKAYSAVGAGGSYGGNTGQIQATTQGMFESTATISSVSIISGNGNFDAGTIYVYTSVS